MLRKLSAFILLSASTCAAVYAQQTPESKEPAEKAVQRFFYNSFDDGSYLGVQTQEVTKENFARFGLREVRGVAVEKVIENSPAANAGLQANDVIVRFNDEEVTGSRKLIRLISEVAPDHQAKLTILRGGGEREIIVTVGKRETPKLQNMFGRLGNLQGYPGIAELPEFQRIPLPNAPPPPLRPGEPNGFLFFGQASRQIGIGVSALTKQLGEYFGASEGKGLLINNVRENSPAAKAGLKAGDIITQIEGKEVKSNLDLIRALNEKKEGEITITIIRDRDRQTVRVTPETLKGGPVNFGERFEKFDENNAPMKFQMLAPQPPNAPVPPTFFAPRIL
ncbi:MAG: PDZ domain-containing protein [Pyrinomonadaceae bacterium]|nr:PDZ domain-containing protein [Pyrinomonadaceae bacterium]